MKSYLRISIRGVSFLVNRPEYKVLTEQDESLPSGSFAVIDKQFETQALASVEKGKTDRVEGIYKKKAHECSLQKVELDGALSSARKQDRERAHQ
jgi:hypothetical protein